MKAKELSTKSIEELKKLLKEKKADLVRIRLENSVTPRKNNQEVKELKKDISRILTLINEKDDRRKEDNPSTGSGL